MTNITSLVTVLCAITLLCPVAIAHGDKKKETTHGASHQSGHDQHSKSKQYENAEQHPFGKASDPKQAKVTIHVDMLDTFRFEPALVEVNRGDTVRFVVRNKGQLMHEMVLGTKASLDEHAELMKKFPGMEHDEPHMAHIGPSDEQAMGWQFTDAGEYWFGCLIPGHYDAGMIGKIVVR